jgi:hypothetical protein
MLMLKVLSVHTGLLVLGVIAGCQPVTVRHDEPESRKNPEQVTSAELKDLLAEDYYLEDPSCQDSDGIADIGEQDVHRFGGGSTQPLPHSFQGFSSDGALQGPGFSASVYNFHQQNKCDRTSAGESCDSGARIVSQARNLKICRPDGHYARASIEGISLTSIASLDNANRFYRSVPNARENLRNATVIVLPLVEKVITETGSDGSRSTYSSVTTDNLAYTSNFDGRPAFVIFPKSRNAVSKGRWQNLNLWELPWGMAHEFGHHVFRSHSGIEKLPGTTITLHGLQLGTPIHSIDFDADKPVKGFMLAGRSVGPEQIFGAVNEGFADIFSYYSLGQSATLTEGVDCFEKNRDITSATFANGAPKMISTEVLDIFNATERIAANSCVGADYQDIHNIGAIIAHGIMRLYSSRAATSGATAGEQAGWLLNWADSVGVAIRTDGRPAVTFENLIALAIAGVAESDSSLTVEQCSIVRSVFPAYAGKWLTGKFTCRN